jgi:YegS/Rv2252/BmrU family lipid kinase
MDSAGNHNSRTRAFVVINPVAGRRDMVSFANELREEFARAGWRCTFHFTALNEDLPAIVRSAHRDGHNLIVAVGGDGTVSDVAEALVHTGVPMAIIPVGTGNVMARELWIPMGLPKACRIITGEHRITSIDAMKIGDAYYFLNVSAGFASLMIRDTQRRHKKIYGVAAYLYTGFLKLLGFQPRRFDIEVDGKSSTFWASEVSIANSGILARRPFLLGTDIRISDGCLDVCIIRAKTLFDYLGLLVSIVMRLHKYDRNILHIKARKNVTLASDHVLTVQADGEVIGATPLEVHVVPNAVKVIVPRKKRRLGKIIKERFNSALQISPPNRDDYQKSRHGTPVPAPPKGP